MLPLPLVGECLFLLSAPLSLHSVSTDSTVCRLPILLFPICPDCMNPSLTLGPSRNWLLFTLSISTLLLAYFIYTPTTDRHLFTKTHQQTATMSLSSKLSITDLKLEGERVLIRVDFNVP